MGKDAQTLPAAPALLEGRDYVMEGGFLVFTAGYLRGRGYCCGSGCRHCPYDTTPSLSPNNCLDNYRSDD